MMGEEIQDTSIYKIKETLEKEGLEANTENAFNLLNVVLQTTKVDQDKVKDSFYEWAKAYVHIEDKPFDPEMTGWNFWKGIYEMDLIGGKTVIRKASQIGASFFSVLLSFWYADVYPDRYFLLNKDKERAKTNISGNVGYVFPVGGELKKFVGGKVADTINESPHIRDMMTRDGIIEMDNLTMKKFRDNVIYYAHSQNQTSLKSWSAGLVILDEFAEMTEGTESLARRRMNAYSQKTRIILSNPELPDLNIDAEYKKGTQMHYYVKCEKCGEWDTPDFFTFHNLYILEKNEGKLTEAEKEKLKGASRWVCPSCHEDIVPSKMGEWREHVPSASYRSIHIPLILSPSGTAEEHWEDWEKSRYDEHEKTDFYKHALGLPYINSENCLQESDVMRCKRNYVTKENHETKTIMGLDWGQRDHYWVIAEKTGDYQHRVIAMGVGKSEEEVKEIINKYNVNVFACDKYGKEGGSHEAVLKLCKDLNETGVTAVACEHSEMKQYIGSWTRGDFEIKYNKSMCIDRLYSRIKSQDISLPSNTGKDFVNHHLTFIKKLAKEDDRSRGFLYVPKAGRKMADHYQSAHYFLTVAFDIETEISSKVSPSPFVFYMD